MEQHVVDLLDALERQLVLVFSVLAGFLPNKKTGELESLVYALPKQVCLKFAEETCKELYESLNTIRPEDQRRIIQSRIEALRKICAEVTHSCAHGQSHDANIYVHIYIYVRLILTTALNRHGLLQ
jgi:hypothetical protein